MHGSYISCVTVRSYWCNNNKVSRRRRNYSNKAVHCKHYNSNYCKRNAICKVAIKRCSKLQSS